MTRKTQREKAGAMQARSASEAASVVHDPRWAAVLARDPAADDAFFYSVETTGVYCRPSCGARTPNPRNVAFHRSISDAERAGFRACKRCRPGQPSRASEHAARVAELCRHLAEVAEVPKLDALAARAGLSPSHLHRVFKSVTGLTPRAYARAQRGERVRRELASSATVTQAIYGAGFGSQGRFYEASDALLGMTPSAYKAGGVDTEIQFAVGQCSLGAILVAASPRGVCAVALGDDPELLTRELQDRFPRARLIGGDAAFEQRVAQIVGLVEAPGTGHQLPLDVRGTAFQQRVWQALREIPPGQTVSYGELAERVGAPRAVRAVASACAANTLAVAIPCHRVVRNDGALSGYRWGVARKRALLEREGSD